MMTAKNKGGVTRWDRCKGGETEPDSWRAFKVSLYLLLFCYHGGMFIDAVVCSHLTAKWLGAL